MFDVIVIGGGPGGYVAAIRAAQLGLKTALAEKAELGGVCLNRGCIPTKSLLHTAGILRDIRDNDFLDFRGGSPGFDFSKAMAHKESTVSKLAGGVQYLLNKNGIKVLHGAADIVSPDSISVDGQEIHCKNIVIAVGSSPAMLKIPGSDSSDVLTSDKVLALKELPVSMAIIGGGVIGVEMAYIFQSFSCRTSVIEMEKRLLPLMDHDISRGVEELLKNRGVGVYTGSRVEEIKHGSVIVNSENIVKELSAEKVLAAVGRSSNGLGLPLDKLGIKHSKGIIHTDTCLRTNIPNIYAIGDVNGKYMLAHVASAEGIRAAENIAGPARPMDYSAVPQCIYTDPEAASVGLTVNEAIDKGYDTKISHIPASVNGRSLIEGCSNGFAKVVAEKTSGRILGVHVIAPFASELITQCTAAIRFKATSKELMEIIYPHPSVSELINEAAHGIMGSPVHL